MRLSDSFCFSWRKKKQQQEWDAQEHSKDEIFWYKPTNFEISIRRICYFFESIPTRIKNYFFCLKYPFWRARNVGNGKFLGYGHTWYDSIETGWQKAFGKQLSNDIKIAYKLDKKDHPGLKWKDALQWTQIKEKYATLRLYAVTTERIQEVLSHYEKISIGYCVYCGKQAQYMSTGYILPYCAKCFDQHHEHIKKRLATTSDGKPSPLATKKWSMYKRSHRISAKNLQPEQVESLFKKERKIKDNGNTL